MEEMHKADLRRLNLEAASNEKYDPHTFNQFCFALIRSTTSIKGCASFC
jgi:hypothetical protein